MNNSDGRAERIRLEQLELLEAMHRQEIIDREQAEFARLKPLLAADIQAAWASSSKGQ